MLTPNQTKVRLNQLKDKHIEKAKSDDEYNRKVDAVAGGLVLLLALSSINIRQKKKRWYEYL